MKNNLSLSQQGLILVGLPIGLMLIFSISLFLLFQKVERDATETDRSKRIIFKAYSLVKQYYDAATQLIVYKHQKTEEERAKFQQQITDTQNGLEDLRALIKTDPFELKSFEKLKKISQTGVSLMGKYERHIARSERLSEIEVTVLYAELDMVGAAFTSKLQELISHETSKYNVSSNEERNTRLLSKILILLGIISAIAIGIVLTRIFFKSTTSRLKLLMDNTVRLSKKEALLPKLEGNDEISKLDLFFHKMADDLAEATRKERAILDNAVDVICSINEQAVFTAVNPASLQVWGYEPEKLIGMNVSEILAKDDVKKLVDAISEQKQHNALVNIETKVIAADSSIVHTLWSLRWSESEKSLFCVAHDITDRKELERLKQEFVAVVSHELRTPLTSLQMTLTLLLNGNYGAITPMAQQRVKSAEVGISRLVLLINDLLDMEKMEAGKLSMTFSDANLNELVERSLDGVGGFAEQQNVKIVANIPDKDVPVIADSDRIVQVLINLLSNAIKFTDDDGTVTVKCFLSDDKWCQVNVIDHGPGIPPGYEETIFAKYEQAHVSKSKKTRGTGLGLPICKAIIEQHGGTIGVSNTEGGGSTFWFRIPAVRKSQTVADGNDVVEPAESILDHS